MVVFKRFSLIVWQIEETETFRGGSLSRSHQVGQSSPSAKGNILL